MEQLPHLPLPKPVVVGPPQRIIISIIDAIEKELDRWESGRDLPEASRFIEHRPSSFAPLLGFLRDLWRHGEEQGGAQRDDGFIAEQLRLDKSYGYFLLDEVRAARRLLVIGDDDGWSPILVQGWSKRRLIVTVCGYPDDRYVLSLPHDLHVDSERFRTEEYA